jgi:6-phosphogluconolactonase
VDISTAIVQTYSSAQQAAVNLGRLFFLYAKSCLEKKGKFCVAIPGGKSPEGFFYYISLNKEEITNWSAVHVFWTDERWVKFDSPLSNFGNAMKFLNVIPANYHPFETDKSIEIACYRYEQCLLTTNHPDVFLDLAIVGMGEDGHVASVFPNDFLYPYKSNKGFVIPAISMINVNKRISLSIEYLASSRHVILYALGTSKQQTLISALRQQNAKLPVYQLIKNCNSLTIITDFNVC